MERQGLPSRLERQVLLVQQEPEPAWRLASALGLHPAMERQGLPSRLERQVLLVQQEPEPAWRLASAPRHLG
jgi:hypothetical protein